MKKSFLKRFSGDLLYGVVSLVIMNMVVSIGIYPYLTKVLGEEAEGRILFFTGLMGLVASAIGSGINYGRMKSSTVHETHNGDYNCYLLVLAVISCLVAVGGYLVKSDIEGSSLLGLAVLIFATSVRYYADVEYRLYMNYRGFFFYYLIIAAGYAAGLLLYPLTGSWVSIFLCGEFAGLIFVGVSGHIFKEKPFARSKYFKEDAKSCISLSAAYLMSDFVSYADRILLPVFVNDAAVTYFYLASMVGKMTSLLSTPLNGVITGHLSHYEGKVTKKMFTAIVLLLAGLALIIILGSVVGSYLFVWLLYRDQYEAVKKLFLLANAGQVLFFLSNTLMIVVLRFASERYQLLIGILYLVLFFVIAVPAMWLFGIWGAAWGLFAINGLKFLLITVLGYRALEKEAAAAV